jgi:hypothetical protein
VNGEALSSSVARVTWVDRSTDETGFRVDASINNGRTFTQLAKVAADSTAAIVRNLKAGRDYLFRVSALGAGHAASTPGLDDQAVHIVPLTLTSDPMDTPGWFKVSLSNEGQPTKGEAVYEATDYLTNNTGWVQGTSWQDAVFKAVSGTITITNTAGQQHAWLFGSGPYKVDTADVLHALPGHDLPAGAQKRIVLEDEWVNPDGDYDDFYWDIGVEKFEFDKLLLKRDVEAANLYTDAADNGGSIGENDKYDFKATLKTSVSDLYNVKYEMWNTSGFNTKVATGPGLEFENSVYGAGERFVRFFLDLDSSGEWNTGEPVIDKTFGVKAYKVHQVGIARASTTAALSNAQADTMMQAMTGLVSVRQSTADVRAAAKFVRSGNVVTWTPDPTKPDVLNNATDYQNLIDNVSAGIRIVKGYGGDLAGRDGQSLFTANTSTVLEGGDAGLWAHEWGHSKDLHHRTDDIDALMYPTTGSGRRDILNSSERDHLE